MCSVTRVEALRASPRIAPTAQVYAQPGPPGRGNAYIDWQPPGVPGPSSSPLRFGTATKQSQVQPGGHPGLLSHKPTDQALDGLAALERDIAGKPPEDVNDGEHSAPSKRLLKRVPKYNKTLHGANALIL